MSEQPLSVTKIVSAIGGVLLIASFFLPIVDTKAGASVTDDMFNVKAMRAEVERSRDLAGAQALIEPALQKMEAFAAGPSLLNLSGVVGATNEILDMVGKAGSLTPEARQAASVLTMVRWGLWLVPVVGAVQAVLPLLSRFRRHAGFFGLIGRFAFGLLFVMVALTPLLGAPKETQEVLGSAVYAALGGGGLMMAGGVLGVTRSNFLAVFLVEAGIVAAIVMGIMTLAAR